MKKSTTQTTVDERPTCEPCGAVLTWRDYAYVGIGAHMCKVCHQKQERKRLRGVPVPAACMPKPDPQYGTERTAKLTARPGIPRQHPPMPVPQAKTPKRTRASRRAEARKALAARKGQAA